MYANFGDREVHTDPTAQVHVDQIDVAVFAVALAGNQVHAL